MVNRFSNFQEKRMYIFGELVKRYWSGQLKDVNDLNDLAQDIKEEFDFEDNDIPFIKDHIRIAMGLDPSGSDGFKDELDLIKNFKEVTFPVVSRVDGACEYCEETDCKSIEECKYEAHIYKRDQGPVIVGDKCLSCGACIPSCDFGAIADKIEFLPLIDLLKDDKTDVYVTVAPAIVGQFGDNVSMGKLRTAFKLLGFKDMIEVALFADILTIKEAIEFNHLVQSEDDFFLTSCCCPIWFNLTKKNYPNIFKYMSPSISPMIASGRFLKKLYKDVKVVFIAPCVAKKAETKEPTLKGDIDFVLNFRELKEIFNALQIDLAELTPNDKDQASFGGRVYARTGGVSFSVKTVVNRLAPRRLIKLKSKKVDGVQDCKKVLDDLSVNDTIDYNFIEGMGCKGGCVGGPKTNIEVEKATKYVNDFGEDSLIMTPFDNLNLLKILKQLGLESIEDIVENEEMFNFLTRE
ncbi:[Fe-Fe] hydrogenase large subunit C-terminal domain-containing protein [Serpentinicella sp. ANB-PHB4]|uniref:[Fe-Fe] hydrogenase large subunit C-terminal domain-containing protein n=1 Tax=Serpentinicella sp. ANB-PHB4 TaxID=3074076 RepID=UPI0028555A34|nr:[Fe-Fe] hydrogenase large subunit C-terminal domain-containing protein [Serpentinicella sp. ANB-PHB4]MDR5658385.1 [Fe-Fe] hydrogenase large subunit C-terminal domain-containing protein [Serpentinicella sp. ANB-PHB4]